MHPRLPVVLFAMLVVACGGNTPLLPAPTSALPTPAPPAMPSTAPPASAGTSAHPSTATPTASVQASALASPAASASPTAVTVTPTVFAEGIVSGPDEEYRISFAPDGQTAWFARGDGFFPETREATIMETRFVDGAWTEPTTASFSGTYPDIDPWISPDGASIYFSSIRPTGGEERGDTELFRVDRLGDGWGEPVHLDSLGSTRDELGASVDEAGVIYFASDRTGGVGGWDLYTAAPAADGFAAPTPVVQLNTQVWEFIPAVDAGGTTLLFTSIGRAEGRGLGDLFVSTRDGESWSAARPLAVNSAADEYHPSLAPDGETIYFVRRATNGNLYEAPWPAADPATPN